MSKWVNHIIVLVLLILSFGCADSKNYDRDSMSKTVLSSPMQDIIKRYYRHEVASKNQKAIINLYIEHFTDTVSFKLQAVNHTWELIHGAVPTSYSEVGEALVHIHTGLGRLSAINHTTSYYENASLYLYGKLLSEEELEERFTHELDFFPAWEIVLKADKLKVSSYKTQVYNVPEFNPHSDSE